MDNNKEEVYKDLSTAVGAVLGEEKDPLLWMSTLPCLIKEFMKFYWVGFYRVLPGGDLAVGPYQGTLACLRIPRGRGACGLAAEQGESIVIPDVEEFSSHISCDSNSRSEIVVPVKDSKGRARAVLDIDSDETGTFDSVDQAHLEELVFLMKDLEWD
ncbi:MAG: GAF domain-containing protein [Acidobacteriota bacterium]